MNMRDMRCGLTITECVAAAGAAGVLAAMLVAGLTTPRRLSSMGESSNNLRQIAAGHAMYGADFGGKFATFSWTKGNCPSAYDDLKTASSDVSACANQAVDILRRRFDPTFPKTASWIPHIYYSGLVLSDYLNRRLPDRMVASPEQVTLLKWQSNAADWQQAGAPNNRAPFGSSYEILTPAFFSTPDSGDGALYQTDTQSMSVPATAQFRSRLASDVAFPSQKVLSFDKYQWHFGPRVAFFMYGEARVLVSMCDGTVSVRHTEAGNRGWNPTNPSSPEPSWINYAPASYEPPTLSGQPQDLVVGQYRWTRRALVGRDFDGPEVP